MTVHYLNTPGRIKTEKNLSKFWVKLYENVGKKIYFDQRRRRWRFRQSDFVISYRWKFVQRNVGQRKMNLTLHVRRRTFLWNGQMRIGFQCLLSGHIGQIGLQCFIRTFHSVAGFAGRRRNTMFDDWKTKIKCLTEKPSEKLQIYIV